MTFEEHINGIEDKMLAALQAEMPFVESFGVYSGELDNLTDQDLKKTLEQMKADFPLVLVGYADGKDEENPKTARRTNAPGKTFPVHFRHDCSFLVFCLASNPRGRASQKRPTAAGETGVIKMISKVREILAGAQFVKTDSAGNPVLVDGKPVVFNEGWLVPRGNEYVAQMPGITVYAVIFETFFRYSTRDRSLTGTDVNEIIIGTNQNHPIDVLSPACVPQNNRPGVHLK